jgi:hypothetical protein
MYSSTATISFGYFPIAEDKRTFSGSDRLRNDSQKSPSTTPFAGLKKWR